MSANEVLITAWKAFPFYSLVILAALQSIPQEIYEAARVDGAGSWQLFRYITIPSIGTTLELLAVLARLVPRRRLLEMMISGERIKADEAEIARSLQGSWRDEHLFSGKQALALYDAYAEQIAECDVELERLLGALKAHELPDDGLGRPKRRTPAKNAVRHFDTRAALFEASGVDLTRIPGIDTSTALKVISEVGTDLRRFPTVKHFTSWMGLCPGTKISGGKVLSSATKRCSNRAAQALRMAAQALRRSQSALGAYHRRLCARMDRPKAITATAHKLARLIYFMLTKGQPYVDVGQQYYEDRYRERVFQNLTKRAHTLGFQLIPVATVV